MYWTSYVNAITNAGVIESTKIHEKYKLRSLNQFSLFTVVLAFIWGVFFLWLKWYTPALFIVFVQLSFSLLIVLNFKRWYTLAKIALIFATNISVMGITAILGYHAGFYLYLFTAPLFVFWLFDLKKEKVYITIGTLTYFLCYIFTLFFKKGFSTIILIKKGHFEFSMYDLNIVFALGFCIFLFNNYTTYFLMLRKQLIQEQEKLKNEITLRRKDQKRLKRLYEKVKITNVNLEQFGFIVSHNIRAPFANIKGFLDLYEPDPINQEENTEVIDCVKKSVSNLDGVLNDLVFLLTLRKDLQEEKEVLLLSTIIQEIKQSLDFDLKYKDIDLQEKYIPSISINTVRTIMHSIIFNLVQNAIKYRKPNEKSTISIDAKESQNTYTIEVCDNGIGIDLEKHKHKIFSLYNKLNTKIEGKGVGLYMVKTQVNLLGGEIRVESQPNIGTRFIISLPKY